MTLQSSGAISFANINTELGVASTTTRSLNDTVARTLAGVASGAISMSNFYGKSSSVTVSYTYTTNTQNASLNVSTIGGYVSGVTTITVTVNSGIYLWSSSTGTPGLYITGRTGGDTLTLVNNGYIIGCGGSGAGYYGVGPNSPVATGSYGLGGGGPALSIGCSLTIQNNSYIAGGGGGGGGLSNSTGGGGAGGGNNGPLYWIYNGPTPVGPGFVPAIKGGTGGGGIGSSGAQGAPYVYGSSYAITSATGGGGGRILPGTTTPTQSATNAGVTATSGAGGGANNAGGNAPQVSGTFAYGTITGSTGGAGGQAGGGGALAYGTAYYGYVVASAGGGGWGAAGGSVIQTSPAGTGTTPGASGGNCVQLNGNTVTWSATGNRYGAIA